MSLFRLDSIVYFEHTDVEYVLPHKHEMYELVYYLNGKGEVNYLGEKHEYRADTVSLMPPHIKHDEQSYSPTNVYIVQFAASSRAKLHNLFCTLKPEDADWVVSVLKRMRNEFDREGRFKRQMIDDMLELVVLQLLRAAAQSVSKSAVYAKGMVNEAKEYIQKHYAENIDFENLADSTGYSYHRFRHLFKEVVGSTPAAYLLEQRLSRAKELLEMTELSVAEIAASCGFSSRQYFINFFRNRVGTSPAKYRKFCKTDNPIGVTRF